MISANIPNETRKAVYRRDGYACALCGDPRTLQIHHAIARSQGGSNDMQNLICLCQNCHALVHGCKLIDTGFEPSDVEQACIEYLADFYAGQDWYPLQDPP